MVECASIAQSVERIHGKDEVTGSNPVRGSRIDYTYGCLRLWHPFNLAKIAQYDKIYTIWLRVTVSLSAN